MKFRYPVYNPCSDVLDVATDWGQTLFDSTQDISLVLAQPYKIAAVRVFFNQPTVYSYNPAIKDLDLSQFDLVLISDAEYSTQQEITDWIQTLGIKNWLLAIGGTHEHETIDSSKVIFRNYYINRYLDANSFCDTYADSKPFLFDCLLGARRPHRDYVMLALTHSGLLDKSIVTYRDCFPGAVVNNTNQQIAELFPTTQLNWPYVSPNLNARWEVSDNVNNQVSFISPYDVYCQTHYSIITETLGTGNCFFLSEKTIKAAFCKRVFVTFGNRGYLKKLHDIGFQTFGDVIDESYDTEHRDAVRYQKAMLQVLKLAYLEQPNMVKQHIDYALENNHRVLHWLPKKAQQEMQDMLVKHIPLAHFYF